MEGIVPKAISRVRRDHPARDGSLAKSINLESENIIL